MRLFAALLMPDDAVASLLPSVERARATEPDLRWTTPHQWHVTMGFFGDVPESAVDDLETRLARAAARTPPLTLGLGRPATFGSPGRARVLVCSVAGDTDPLRRLAASARAAGRRAGLTTAGLAADARFRPHVTLARVSPPRDVSAALATLGDVEPSWWSADVLTLVRSDLGAGEHGRAVHTAVARLALDGRGRRTVP